MLLMFFVALSALLSSVYSKPLSSLGFSVTSDFVYTSGSTTTQGAAERPTREARLVVRQNALTPTGGNATCSNALKTEDPATRWQVSNGNAALDQFLDMWNNDKLICDDCWGLAKGDCHSDLTGCVDGLKTLAKAADNGSARWDTGIGMYTNVTGGLLCGYDSPCELPECPVVHESAAAYVLIQSLTNLHSWLHDAHDQLQSARISVLGKADKFATVFAPLPDYKFDQTFVGVLAAVGSTVIGSLGAAGGPLAGGIAATIGGIGSAITNNLYGASEDKTPADIGSAMTLIGDSLVYGAGNLSNTVLGAGTWTTKNGSSISLADLMRDGNLVVMGPSIDDSGLQDQYKKVIYQQLATYTWNNLQQSDWKPKTFITFAPGKCEDIDYKDSTKSPIIFTRQDDNRKLSDFDAHINWNGSCYWLLGAANKNTGAPCDDVHALPGGTNQAMKDNSADFGGLTLEDFIIPSVRGYWSNGNENGFPLASSSENLVLDPQAAGALNITVCDYLKYNKGGLAGIGCPLIHQTGSNANECQLEPANAVANAPASWSTGQCRIHLQQTNKMPQHYSDQWDELNPYPDQFQLESETFDSNDRSIGNTAMEWVGGIMDLWNSVLPYAILVHVDDDAGKAMEFWYGDQYWNSDDPNHHCNTTGYQFGAEKEQRNIDCFFDCPAPGPSPSASATIGHPLPTNVKFENPDAATAVTNSIAQARPTDIYEGETYHAGPCWVQVNQYKMDDPNKFWAEGFLKQTNDKRDSFTWIAQGENGKVPVNANEEFSIEGAGNNLNVKFDPYTTKGGNGHVTFNYGGNVWNELDTSKEHSCEYKNYDSHTNVRPIWCFFTCV